MPSGLQKAQLESGLLPKDEQDVLAECYNVIPRKPTHGTRPRNKADRRRWQKTAITNHPEKENEKKKRYRQRGTFWESKGNRAWKPYELSILTFDLTQREMAYALKRSTCSIEAKLKRINHAVKNSAFLETCRTNPDRPWKELRGQGGREKENTLMLQHFVSVCDIGRTPYRHFDVVDEDGKAQRGTKRG